MLLKDKVAIVSGIGPGLGRDAALALAREGADLALAARNADALEAMEQELAPFGRRVLRVRTDITRKEDCAHLVEEACKFFGRIDVLVNNAYHAGTYVPIEEDDVDATWLPPFEVNVLGTLKLTQAVLPVMKRQGSGSIVMINSMIIRQPLPTMAGYAASKAALMAATQTLAREVGGYGVRVNSVVPGYIWGAALEGYFALQAKQLGVDPKVVYDGVAKNIALGHIPTSEEIAGAIVFFASDLSSVITGQSLDVNGGHELH